MNKQYINHLYKQYQSGKLTEQEQKDWHRFVTDSGQDQALLDLIDADWYRTDSNVMPLSRQMQEDIFQDIIKQPQIARSPRKVISWSRIAVAASIVGLFTIMGLYLYKSQPVDSPLSLESHDIVPGKAGATLTMADGTIINLSDAATGELAQQSGLRITKDSTGQLSYEIADATGNIHPMLNNVRTSKGESYRIRLPDGSLISLNASSSIHFTTPLIQHGRRTVRLEGEGYFEIAKDSDHPFIVETDQQKVQVLGTHFNITAYPDQKITKTTLLEGSIDITAFGQAQRLKPGQQAILKDNNLQVQNIATPQQSVAWKNEEFVFDNTSLEDIMTQISRWYNVDISYSPQVIDPGFGGSISRSRPIEEVLHALEKTQGVHFKIQGRRILVMP